jgi:hypothetical protein
VALHLRVQTRAPLAMGRDTVHQPDAQLSPVELWRLPPSQSLSPYSGPDNGTEEGSGCKERRFAVGVQLVSMKLTLLNFSYVTYFEADSGRCR